MKASRVFACIGASLVAASCLFVSPLDGLNESSGGSGGDASAPDASGGSAGAGGGGECTTHKDCIPLNPDEPWRCVGNKCVQLTTQECRCVPKGVLGVNEPWMEPGSIVIGAFAALDPSKDACGDDPESRNYRLAVEQINSKTREGLPGPNGTKRPIALLLCDNAVQRMGDLDYEERRDIVLRATGHLTETLKVPGILAHMELGHLKTAFETFNTVKQTNVFFLTPSGVDNDLGAWKESDDDGLLWHMLGLPGDVAPAYAELVPLLEKQVRDQVEAGDLGATTGPVKVLLLTTQADPYEGQLASAIEAALAQKQIQTDPNYVFKRHDVTLDEASLKAAAALIGTGDKPHIVLSTLSGAAFFAVFWNVDKNWNPYYVLSPLNFGELNSLENYITAEITKGSTGYDRRFLGVNVAGTELADLKARYSKALDALFPDLLTPDDGENFYDSVYFMAYAMLGGGTLSTVYGRDIRDGMKRLSGQSPVYWVGIADTPEEDDTAEITELLLKDETTPFLLMGASGPGEFNTDTGVRKTTASVYCFEWSAGAGGGALMTRDHVGHYDLGSHSLRLSSLYATPPCLKKLNLPAP